MSRFLLVIFIIYVHFDVASFQLQYLLLLLYILCSNFVLLCFIEMQFLCGQTKSFSGPKGTVENVALMCRMEIVMQREREMEKFS